MKFCYFLPIQIKNKLIKIFIVLISFALKYKLGKNYAYKMGQVIKMLGY